jgi:hypothetical protein
VAEITSRTVQKAGAQSSGTRHLVPAWCGQPLWWASAGVTQDMRSNVMADALLATSRNMLQTAQTSSSVCGGLIQKHNVIQKIIVYLDKWRRSHSHYMATQ